MRCEASLGSASLRPPGTKRQGSDGRTYMVTVAKEGVHRWHPVSPAALPSRNRVVRTVNIIDDNGCNAFVVDLTSTSGPGVARVHARWEEEGLDKHRFWRALPYFRVFVGLDPSEDAAGTACGTKGWLVRLFSAKPAAHAWGRGGNSLLLQTGPQSYTYVGRGEVYAFQVPPGDEITEFWSPMVGKCAMPYGVGARNTYLMLGRTWVANAQLPREANPYHIYRSYDLMTGEALESEGQRSRVLHRHAATHPLPAFKMLYETPQSLCALR